MSFMNEVNPTVTIKKKNLFTLIEYCIENKIDHTVKSRSESSDEFDVEFLITNTKKAIALGMCLKELKLELNGLNVTSVSAIKANKKVMPAKETGLTLPANGEAIESEPIMAFEDALQFDLGTSN